MIFHTFLLYKGCPCKVHLAQSESEAIITIFCWVHFVSPNLLCYSLFVNWTLPPFKCTSCFSRYSAGGNFASKLDCNCSRHRWHNNAFYGSYVACSKGRCTIGRCWKLIGISCINCIICGIK